MSSPELKRWISNLHLEESGAADALGNEESGEANHGSAAVEHLGVGGERTEGGTVGAVLHVGHERCGGEQSEDEDHGAGDLAELLQHGLAAGELSAEGGDEAEHGEASVDDLGSGAGEGHGVEDAQALGGGGSGGRGSGSGSDNGLLLLSRGLDDDVATSKTRSGDSLPHGQRRARDTGAGGGDGSGGHHDGSHCEI